MAFFFDAETARTTPKTWYHGHCHCKALEFKVHLPDIYSPDRPPNTAATCNCSICTKNGYVFVYALREQFVWLSGQDTLKEYRFASKSTAHKFCGNCGSSVLNDPMGVIPLGDILCVNARMLNDVDIPKMLSVARKVNGRDEVNPEYNDETA